MAQELINIGTVPDDGTGENIRLAFEKCNTMYTELYNAVPAPAAYTRPSDWLTMPVLEQGDEQWSGLYPIYDVDGNFLAISATTSDVGYTVDWGDGSTPEDIASGVTAEHQYDYADFALQTACTRGYKQAIVTITPQTTETLVTIDPIVIHSNAGDTGDGNSMPWLDIVVAGSGITACVVGWRDSTYSPLLEKFTYVGTHSITNFNSMFSDCCSLQSITLGDLTAGTDFSSMFNSCYSLQSITLGDLTAGTSFSYMFGDCYSLQSITLGDLTAGTSFGSMFCGCCSLQSITLGDLTAGTDFSSMFNSCSSLQSITLGDLTAGTDFSSMFNSCSSLQSITLGDLTAGTSFGSMFCGCCSLQSITLGDMSIAANVTNLGFMFCTSLSKATLGLIYSSMELQWSLLSATSLIGIFTALPIVVDSQIINLYGVYGYDDLIPTDIAIATDKGWTITAINNYA